MVGNAQSCQADSHDRRRVAARTVRGRDVQRRQRLRGGDDRAPDWSPVLATAASGVTGIADAAWSTGAAPPTAPARTRER